MTLLSSFTRVSSPGMQCFACGPPTSFASTIIRNFPLRFSVDYGKVLASVFCNFWWRLWDSSSKRTCFTGSPPPSVHRSDMYHILPSSGVTWARKCESRSVLSIIYHQSLIIAKTNSYFPHVIATILLQRAGLKLASQPANSSTPVDLTRAVRILVVVLIGRFPYRSSW